MRSHAQKNRMNQTSLHPNTQTLLSAWQRMVQAPSNDDIDPSSRLQPNIVEFLFVVERRDSCWTFRNAGAAMSNILGRELADQNFLDFWSGYDQELVSTLMNAVAALKKPGFLTARGETLIGKRVDIELTLAPLLGQQSKAGQERLLGLYQILDDSADLGGRPVWRHRLTSLSPPDLTTEFPGLRLVGEND